MRLSQLCRDIGGARLMGEDAQVSGLCIDSRKVEPGDLFFCLPGLRADGHAFAPQAIEKGAAALVCERALDIPVPQVIVQDARAASSYMAQAFYRYPAREMIMVGVTGTKGKTTTCYLIKAVADAAGRKCGLIGSAINMIGEKVADQSVTTPTTPDPIELQKLLRAMADEGCTMCVMEVTANAMYFRRVEGMAFDAGVFTNFSQDHLDLFGDMDNYFEHKLRFFDGEFCAWAAVNADDQRAGQILTYSQMPLTTYGVSEPSDVYARDIEIREDGVSFTLGWGATRLALDLRLSGLFNVYNAMAAAMVCQHCGISSQVIKRGLESVKAVPGRLEMLDTETPYRVFLDFAHAPNALENVLTTIRQFTKGRVITLFGCGGDRDRGKRPLMGEIAGRLSDAVILTSDNPRTEEPMDIIRQIEEGLEGSPTPYEIIENRREAIARALGMAGAGDTVVLAGKGQEIYQEIMGEKHPFDEKQIVAEILSPRS